MKKSVVDIYDLQEMAPFFKGRVGTWLGKLLIKCLRVDLVNKVHARNCHLRGAEFYFPLYCMTPLSISAMRFIIRRF